MFKHSFVQTAFPQDVLVGGVDIFRDIDLLRRIIVCAFFCESTDIDMLFEFVMFVRVLRHMFVHGHYKQKDKTEITGENGGSLFGKIECTFLDPPTPE